MYAYYYLLLPGVLYPFIGNILALFFISLAYCLFISQHGSLSFTQKLIFCGLAISLPTYGAMFEFSFQIAQVYCSAALVVGAYLLTINGNSLWTKWILPVVLCTFATLTYQSLLYIFPGLFLIDCLLGKFNIAEKSSYRVAGRIIFICIISLICYLVGSMFFLFITGFHGTDGLARSTFSNRPIVDALKVLCRWLVGEFGSTLLSSFWFLPVPIGIILCFGKPHLRYAVLLVLVIGYFFFPFFGLGIALPIRAWVFAPFIFAGIFLSAYIHTKGKWRILFVLFSVWIICFNSSINAKFALLDDFSGKRDQLIASRIYNELSDIEPKYLKEAKQSLIIGTVKLGRILPKLSVGQRQIYGASFFSWFNEYGRIYRYLRIFGVDIPPTINHLPKAKTLRSLDVVREMPVYPAKGFIKVVDDVLVIKLAEQKK